MLPYEASLAKSQPGRIRKFFQPKDGVSCGATRRGPSVAYEDKQHRQRPGVLWQMGNLGANTARDLAMATMLCLASTMALKLWQFACMTVTVLGQNRAVSVWEGSSSRGPVSAPNISTYRSTQAQQQHPSHHLCSHLSEIRNICGHKYQSAPYFPSGSPRGQG